MSLKSGCPMSVQLVELKLQVPKELNDVRVLLIELVKDLKDKKDLATVAAENLLNLSTAVAGLTDIPTEFAQEKQKTAQLAGLMGGELLGALI